MQIVFVLFPSLTQLDLTAPLQVLHSLPGATIHLPASTLEPVPSDCGLSLLPTCTFEQIERVDLLCVPGGFGVSQAITDERLMRFVRKAAEQADYITSVCTGAFILGAAGSLQGKRATTHWAYRPLLTKVGAVPTDERVVRDGRVITGGGVTAGIDFAFSVVEEIAGAEIAEQIQVRLEYRPQARPYPEGPPDMENYARRVAEFARELDAVRG